MHSKNKTIVIKHYAQIFLTKYLRKKSYDFYIMAFKMIKVKGTLANSFYEACITLIPKLDRDITRKLQTNISHEYRHKSL